MKIQTDRDIYPDNFTPLASSAESMEMDRLAQQKYGLGAEILMESAGALSAEAIISYLLRAKKQLQGDKASSVMVLCGPGHNGGDGLVTARHLLSANLNVDVFLPDHKINQPKQNTDSEENDTKNQENLHGSGDIPLYERQKQRLLNQGVTFKSLNDLLNGQSNGLSDGQGAVRKAGAGACVIVDALFGVGLSRDVKEPYASLIQWINQTGQFVVSLDTPSGLDVDTGHIRGQAVRANLTLTFGLAKPGFYLMHGPMQVGQINQTGTGQAEPALRGLPFEKGTAVGLFSSNKANVKHAFSNKISIKVFSLGYPSVLLRKNKKHFLIKKSWVSAQLPRRQPTDHKAQHGHLLVLAGSPGFWGAGCLTAEAGYRMGAGYVTLVSVGQEGSVKAKLPDVLTQDMDDPDLLKNKTAVAIGPGLSVGEKTKQLLLKLKETDLPVVVDASAWTVCVREKLFPLPSHWVVTPHSGELASLFGVTGHKVDENRCSYAMKGSATVGCLVLLKGFYSVLAQQDKCWIIPAGNSALAKAGTGDVLTGFIGSLMARGLSAFSASATGAFVHGLLAEEWVRSGKDQESLMAQDLKDILPFVLQKLKKSNTK